MTALINRQHKILQQLDELRQQILTLKSDLCNSNDSLPEKQLHTASASSTKLSNLPNIVVIANPSQPPYFLLLIRKLWSDHVNLKATTHVHSSVDELSEKALLFTKDLENTQIDQAPVSMSVRLIWKNVEPNPELIISQVPIIGEVNILRYLARIAPSLLSYECLENVFEIDSVLDVTHCITRSRTKTERISLLQALNKKLGKSNFFCGHSNITIADVAVSSALKHVADSEINRNMSKWLKRVETVL